MPVLYLDFDGVLHNDHVYRVPGRGIVVRDGCLFEWAHYLDEALQPYPSVRIVLSTSWVRELGFNRAKSYLAPSLQARVVGATFHRREHAPTRELRWHWAQMPRGVQIMQDVERRRPSKWLALDDAVGEFNDAQRAQLIACDSERGLSDLATRAQLQAMLKRLESSRDE
ncbi:HAD domain-containing protein [Aquincola sp. J276]|uniref:HAD domain-containing protein n=1 Tax=Aquincola sp. J276 TaxID=2898432 RepID=UPI0021515D10|nr:HAD domain-containing protein [Aquincola sp. J276]MCR5865676.1 hypothetical protein [Aquincola sp. J276]